MNLITATMVALLTGPAGIETAQVIDRGAESVLADLSNEARVELRVEIRKDVHNELRQRMEDATAQALAESHRNYLASTSVRTPAKSR